MRYLIYALNGLAPIQSSVLVLILGYQIFLVLNREQPKSTDVSKETVICLLALFSTSLLISFAVTRNTEASLSGSQLFLENLITIAALLLLWMSVKHLGRNFSVFPQRRYIVTSGPYALVRHPMYLSYLIFDLSFWIFRQDALVALLWLIELILLAWRARLEESKALETSVEYRAYKKRVPALVPFC